jgi:hypothetical protein
MAITFAAASQEVIAFASEVAALRTTASLSCWIITTQVGDDTMWVAPGVIGIEEAGAGDDIFWGWIDNNSGTSRIGMQAGDNPSAKSTSQVNDGELHHILVTWNSVTGAVQVFFDGALEGTATSGTGDRTIPFDELAVIDDTGGTPTWLSATLHDVRVYDWVMGLPEAQALYRQQGGDSIIYGRVHRWTLDEGYPGESLSGSGLVKDTGSGQNAGTPTNTPTGAEFPVGTRRRRAA